MDDYSRISNTLIAIMNCKDSELEKSTMNMKYNDKEERLRVILWGSINFIKDMVDSIEIIVKQNDL
ncbi:hypothetical protein [Clostridium sp. Marseille-Q2269]|uniref:hypothetical protein n=1 Tax=Clostridium sp. Marseille-Q2269 TaxID=2942205 RepID=UPI00207352DA|nr:hypothetical protein [Clostridium sp. Marseille-Q2269]